MTTGGGGDECAFSGVADYVVVEILGHLVERPWCVARFGATCRRMRCVVISNPQLWSRVDTGTLDVPARSPMLMSLAGTLTARGDLGDRSCLAETSALISRMPNLRTLSVSVRDWTAEGMRAFHESLPASLVSLSMTSWIRPLGDDLLKTLGSCSGLKSLELREIGESVLGLGNVWARAPQHLQRLGVSFGVIEQEEIGGLSVREPLLELSLRSWSSHGDWWDCVALTRCCPNVQSLHLDVARSYFRLGSLSSLKRLRELSLIFGDFTGDEECDEYEEPPPYSPHLGVTSDEYEALDDSQKRLLWCSGMAAELKELVNAEDCATFEKVRLAGLFADLSDFFGGRRCKGLRDLELDCRMPEGCWEVIAECCGMSLRRVSCSRDSCSGYLMLLLSKNERLRPNLHEICLPFMGQEDFKRVLSLLEDSSTVTKFCVPFYVITQESGAGFVLLQRSLPALCNITLECRNSRPEFSRVVDIAKSHPNLDQVEVITDYPENRPRDLPPRVSWCNSWSHFR